MRLCAQYPYHHVRNSRDHKLLRACATVSRAQREWMRRGDQAAMEITRRGFVKLVTSSGIVLGISHLSTAAEPTFRARETLPGEAPWNPSAAGKGRVDGVAK